MSKPPAPPATDSGVESGALRPLRPTRLTDDPEAVERVYAAVSGTSEATVDADGPECPTVADVATATDLDRIRVFLALAVLLDAGVVRAIRRSDGPLGFGGVHD